MTYIEDILHVAVDSDDILLDQNDRAVLKSISQQCKKGTALTDRQYQLVFNKLLKINDQLLENNIVLTQGCETRLPLREIDRTKRISIVSHADMVGSNSVYESYKNKWNWIKIVFPFNKKDIAKISEIQKAVKKGHYIHSNGSREHYVLMTPSNAYHVVSMLSNRNFEIDADILETAEKTKKILDNKNTVVPHVTETGLVNVHQLLANNVNDDIGMFDNNNALLFKDRSIRYGYAYQDFVDIQNLECNIACRTQPECLVDPDKFTIDDIAVALKNLQRFPLLVLIDSDESCDQLVEIHQAFEKIIPNEFQSVLFRVDSNDKNSHANQYIKDNKLNNWVDSKTKIVYIKKDKLPKALLSSDFVPVSALGKTSRRSNSSVDIYMEYRCDLIVYNDTQENLFRKHSKKYGIM